MWYLKAFYVNITTCGGSMNSLEKKIKEITDRILEYTKEIDNLNNRDEELATEKEYYDEKLSKINKLKWFHFEES